MKRSRSKPSTRGRWRSLILGPQSPAAGRALRAIAYVVTAAVLIIGWMWGVPRLEAYAATSASTAPFRAHFIEPPEWMDADTLAYLEQVVIDRLGEDALSWEALESVRTSLARTGWFDRVERVERGAGNVVRIRGAYVEPFAVIRDRDGHHLVDRAARLLPKRFPPDAPPRFAAVDGQVVPWFMVIDGPIFPRPAGVGSTWDGIDVASGLRLAEYLQPMAWNGQIASIDVSDYAQAESLWLVTVGGARILWGRAPGDESAVEVPAHQKAAYLTFFFEKYGRIDRGLRELDITQDHVYAR